MVDKNFKGKKEWFTVDDSIPIPPEALDLTLRRVPEGFVLPYLQGRKKPLVPHLQTLIWRRASHKTQVLRKKPAQRKSNKK
jgi:hypothetical protein